MEKVGLWDLINGKKNRKSFIWKTGGEVGGKKTLLEETTSTWRKEFDIEK